MYIVKQTIGYFTQHYIGLHSCNLYVRLKVLDERHHVDNTKLYTHPQYLVGASSYHRTGL